MKIYLDGQFVEQEQARLSVFDAGVQHAVGLFETMRAYGGKTFRLDAHMHRLTESAKQTGLTDTLRSEPLAQAVELTLKKNDSTDARVRLTITGGPARSGAPAQPSIIITATPPTDYPESFFTEGVTAVVADPKANPFDPTAGHKTLNYWSRLRSLAQAAAAKAGEALWFSVTNHLCGGAVSNAFIVKDGQLHTPIARGEEVAGAIPSAVLPGIIRGVVMELAANLNIPVHRRMLTINDVLEADELFLTNSSWLVLPVVKVEKETIGGGKPGPVTQQVREKMLKIVAHECGPLAPRAQSSPDATAAARS